MRDNFDDLKHMMPADRDHAWCGVSPWEAVPVGSEPEFADRLAKDFERNAAAAEQAARAAFGMSDDSGFYPIRARIAFDRHCYLVGASAIGLGLVVMLGALLWLGPSWLRAAPPHVTFDDRWPSWCAGFSGLSCSAQDNARK